MSGQFGYIVSEWMRNNGRLGASVRQLTQEERDLGVRVRVRKAELIRQGYTPTGALQRARSELIPVQCNVMPDQTHAAQLAERCRRLERELRETREALMAAERRENDLIDRLRVGL